MEVEYETSVRYNYKMDENLLKTANNFDKMLSYLKPLLLKIVVPMNQDLRFIMK